MPQIPNGIGGLASTRRGFLLRPDLLADGVSDYQLRALTSSGLVQRIARGAMLLSGVEPDWYDELAAVVYSTPGSAASHTSSARVYGLDGITTWMLEVTIPYECGGGPIKGVFVHRTRRAMDVRVVDGIPVVSVEQTLLDLASMKNIGGKVLLKALASAIRKRLTTTVALNVFLAGRGRGTRGLKRLREALARYDDGSPPPGSDGEVAMFEFFIACGIELPTRQYEITLPNGLHIYLDFAWELRTRAIEFDGLASRATPHAHDGELERQNTILDLGWGLRRFSPIALRERPKETYRQIVRFLES